MASNYECKEADADKDIEERSMHDEVFKTTAAKATAGVDEGAGRGDAILFLVNRIWKLRYQLRQS